MNFNAIEEYEINLFEYGINLEPTPNSSPIFKMHIYKLMPLVPRVLPRQITVGINNNIFVNEPSCKPTASTTVITQNYITVPRFQNTNFSHKGLIVPMGALFICCIMDRNIKDIYLTDNV
jgi:hypothetical protein